MTTYAKSAELFIIYLMHQFMYDENEVANFYFEFRENEAYNFIFKILSKHISGNSKIISEIEYGLKNINYDKPVMIIDDYKKFFLLVGKLADKFKKNFEKGKTVSYGSELVYNYILKLFWLRMTPDDFLHPIDFLEKNIKMLDDNTFIDYQSGKKLDINIKNYDVYASSTLAKSYDEGIKEFHFIIKDNDKEMYLPLIRYGIYEKDSKKICEIASIQDKNRKDYFPYDKKIYKDINRYKYKLNQGVEDDLINDVEPNKLLSLILFIKLLDEKEVHYISIPSMYVLDYEYHDKIDKNMKDVFHGTWRNENQIAQSNEQYKYELKEYLNEIDKQDIISELKTTKHIKLFERLMYHIKNSEILEYPMEQSSFMNIKINNLDDINGLEVSKILKKSR